MKASNITQSVPVVVSDPFDLLIVCAYNKRALIPKISLKLLLENVICSNLKVMDLLRIKIKRTVNWIMEWEVANLQTGDWISHTVCLETIIAFNEFKVLLKEIAFLLGCEVNFCTYVIPVDKKYVLR